MVGSLQVKTLELIADNEDMSNYVISRVVVSAVKKNETG